MGELGLTAIQTFRIVTGTTLTADMDIASATDALRSTVPVKTGGWVPTAALEIRVSTH